MSVSARAAGSGATPTESTPLVGKHEQQQPGAGGEKGGAGGGAGLSVAAAALLVAGEMAGGGVLALPRALVRTGWVGVPVIVATCVAALYSGARLADCWSAVEDREPELRTHQRSPYAIIADRTLGRGWSAVVSMSLLVSLFGGAVVYLLLAAQLVGQVLLALEPTLTICTWYLFVGGAMTPLIFFHSPRDFRWSGVVACGSVAVACLLYFIEMMNEVRPFAFRWGARGFQDFSLALGTILFAFGGASSFPTIQHDMADKNKFATSLQYSFLGLLALYLPVGAGGYVAYGDAVAPNVAASLAATPLALAADLLMTVHLVCAFLILIHPVCQETEALFSVPRESVGWRLVTRLSVMAAVLFLGESVPRFHTILALVGGSSVALLAYVLPNYCYLTLLAQTPRDGHAPLRSAEWMRTACWCVLVCGAAAGGAATWAAVSAIFSTAQATPCYLR